MGIEKFAELMPRIFQPKDQTDLEAVLAVSIIGPIGVPQEEAVYPQVATADSEQMKAMHDYVIISCIRSLLIIPVRNPCESTWVCGADGCHLTPNR